MRAPSRILGDDALAAQVASGNTAAEAELFSRYHRPIIGFCRSILLDAHEADEAAQAAFVKALDALRARPLDAPLRPWLFRIAHNESINLIRHRRRHDGLETAPPVVVPAADVAVEKRERLTELVRDLQALPERQRSALLMREMSGLGYDEIATSLSASEQAVRQTVFEARQTLHEFREGRALECSSVRSVLEAGDRRVLRGKRLRAHLRGCAECEALRKGVTTRRRDLRLLIPALPASGLAALLGGGGAGGVATGGAIKLAVGAVAAMTATVGVVEVGSKPSGSPKRERHAVAQVHVERVAPRSHVHREHTAAVATPTAVKAAAPKTKTKTIPAAFQRARHVVAAPTPKPKVNQGARPLDSSVNNGARPHYSPGDPPVSAATPVPVATATPENVTLKLPISTNRQKVPAVADQALDQAAEQVAAAQAYAQQQVAAAQQQVQTQLAAARAQTETAMANARAQTTAALDQARAQMEAAQAQMQSLMAGFGQH